MQKKGNNSFNGSEFSFLGNQGNSVESDIRTSKGTFLTRQSDPVISRIEYRIANWTQLPMENGEGIQILQYQVSTLEKIQYHKTRSAPTAVLESFSISLVSLRLEKSTVNIMTTFSTKGELRTEATASRQY